MDAPSSFGPSAVAAFIVFIGILIFVHELGHFLAAKYFDIKVLKFSLGFGPPLVRFRRGETQYQIAAVPLGGFVKMVGDNPTEEVAPADRGRSFTAAPIYQRAVIALAGPAFNLVFPVICFFAYNLLGPPVTAPVVGELETGFPAERAGLRTGDRVLSVDGERTWSFSRMADIVSSRAGEELTFRVLRDGKEVTLKVIPAEVVREDLFGTPEKQGIIGVKSGRAGTRVGVDQPAKNSAGFKTGDRILAIDGHPVSYIEDVEAQLHAAAGRTVKVTVARPEALAAGDLLIAGAEAPVTLEVAVPPAEAGEVGGTSPRFATLASLGLANADTFIRGLVPGGAADRAGLRPGDRLLSLNGKTTALFISFAADLERLAREPIDVRVRRAGDELTLKLKCDEILRKHEVTGKERPYYDCGIGLGALPRSMESGHWSTNVPEETERAELSIGEAAVLSVRQTGNVIGFVTLGIFKLFTREISTDTVGGPLTLFQVAAQAAEHGFFAYLHMLAVISVNLGLINLLPIPIFDGGHLVFCAVEAVKRRPLSVRARELASLIGLVLIIALILLAVHNDLSHFDLF